ncbi:MAG: hypothetical protein ACYDBJ_29495 [Aggregatilineales bacterium]
MVEQADQSIDRARSPAVMARALSKIRLDNSMWILTLGVLALMAAVFWGTMGIHTTGLIEDWQTYYTFDGLGISPHTLFVPQDPARPFLTLIYALAYVLTPNSFIGLQILGIIMFISNGLMLYVLVRRLLPDQMVVAFMAAVLFVIYPADTGLFNTR